MKLTMTEEFAGAQAKKTFASIVVGFNFRPRVVATSATQSSTHTHTHTDRQHNNHNGVATLNDCLVRWVGHPTVTGDSA